MKNNILLVPIHLDALFLANPESVVDAKADFTKLPYSTQAGDVNADDPNLSETVLSRPFQDQNLNLSPGVHLHWALPDALTKGIQKDGKLDFPAVPNRWLVSSKEKNGTVQKQWIEASYTLNPSLHRAWC